MQFCTNIYIKQHQKNVVPTAWGFFTVEGEDLFVYKISSVFTDFLKSFYIAVFSFVQFDQWIMV